MTVSHKFCMNCGASLAPGVSRCRECGSEPSQETPAATPQEPDRGLQGLGVHRDEKGVWRWNYEMPMGKNPTLLITVWKGLMLASLVPALLVAFLTLVEDGWPDAFGIFLRVVLMVGGILTLLGLIAYAFVALAYGGSYHVVFEMDDKGVNHIQLDSQHDRAQVLAWLTALAGLAGGSAQAAGAGLLAASKKSSYSEFGKVRKIVLKPSRNVIYVNQALERNQIYADQDMFEAVSAFIIDRCPKAKVLRK